MPIKIMYEEKEHNGNKYKFIKSIPFDIASEIIVKFNDAGMKKESVNSNDMDGLVRRTIIATLETIDDNKFKPDDLKENWFPGEIYIDTLEKILGFAQSSFKNRKGLNKKEGSENKEDKKEIEMPDDTEDIKDEK